MAILVIGSMLLTRNLQKVPKGAQVLVERLLRPYTALWKAPWARTKCFCTLHRHPVPVFLLQQHAGAVLVCGLHSRHQYHGLLGIHRVYAGADFSASSAKGVIGRIKGLCDPPIVTPLNLISEFSTPVSMAFRHFGNIAAGLIITTLLYGALTGLTHMVFGANFQIPILAIGLPAVLSVYFDLFTAFMQAFIISMLTMVFTSMAMD